VAKVKESAPSVDRRGKDRRKIDRRKQATPVAVDRRQNDRRKAPRRRQIDPTTCERDYTNDEIEFMNAMDDYKRRSGRMFPTCSEVLEVVRALGYEKKPGASKPQSADDSAAWHTNDRQASGGLHARHTPEGQKTGL